MKFSRSSTTLLAAAIFLSATSLITTSLAVQAADTMDRAIFVNADELRWDNAPPSLPGGAKMTVLLGDPSKPGPFVLRFKTDGEYKIPPHFHSRAEALTVISGTLYLGGGEKFDPTVAHALSAGGFHYLPAKVPHFAFSKAPTVVEIHGEGPFDIVYLNPDDDPQKARSR
ncbi:MAG: hypothetical protein A2075_04885 [Geobacteraceae bacterium GWC2_58_44]|nr:MAG: hypothetical protein A2075_04885 [Geobacteraceae bacterium GWC2_58_44]HBG08233.1 hypothetical protein [Geobacter sp.]